MGEQLTNLFHELQDRHALHQAGLAGMLKDKDMSGKQLMFLRQSQLIAEDHIYEQNGDDDPLAVVLGGMKRKRPTLLTVCDYRIEKIVVQKLSRASIVFRNPKKGKDAKSESVTIRTDSEFFRMICSALSENDLWKMSKITLSRISGLVSGETTTDTHQANIPLLHKIFYRPGEIPVVYGSTLEVRDSLFFDYVKQSFDKDPSVFLTRLKRILGYGFRGKDSEEVNAIARQIAEYQPLLKDSIKTKRS